MTPALPSIRRRLSRLLVAVVLLWGLVVSVVVWLALAHEVDELLDDTLQGSAQVLASLLEPAIDGLRAPAAPHEGPTGPEAERFAWQLIGPEGQLLMRSPRAPASALLPLPVQGFADAQDWRVFGLRFHRDNYLLYVARSRAEQLEAQAEVALAAVSATLLIGVVAAGWVRLQIRRELQPLAESAQAWRAYSPLQPDAQLAPATRVELVPAHEAIADLGQRLARRVESERAFTAHAAHALRTPLAGIDAQLAVALRECPPALAPRLDNVRQAAGRLTRVVAALLALFRSGTELQWRRIELPAFFARLPVQGLEVRVDPDAALTADADLLAAAMLNLMDNALRHGARTLQVAVQASEGHTVLGLHDDGAGLPQSERVRLQAALQAQRYESVGGLGLMLADRVARAHGGRLVLTPVPQGFGVELHLGGEPV